MALSRTTSRLFSKAPTYTRPSQNPAVGAASGYGGGLDQMRSQFGQAPNQMQVPVSPISSPMAPQGTLPQGGMGMRLAGLMQGFGGMAAAGMTAGMARSREGTRMLQNPITGTPQIQNSLQASAVSQGNPMNQSIAAMSNGYYSPPSSVNQGREYGLTLPMDLAGQQNRIANQNPMYAGMQSRFGAGSVMGQQAATIAQNEGAGNIRIPGSYGEMPTYVQKGESPEVRFRSNANGDQVSFNSNNDPVLKRQQAALRNFTPNAERGANRKAAREATKARLADSRFKMQVSKGLNPNSAKAKAMFPEQVAKMQGSSPNNPMTPAGPPGSIEDQMQGAGMVAQDLASNPHLVSIGATPDSSLQDVNAGMTAHLESGGTFTDESLKAFQQHAVARGKTKTKDNDPFSFNPSFGETQSAVAEGPLWQQLAEMPDTPEARAQWFQMYKDLKEQTKKRAADSLYRNPPRAGA